MSNPLDNLPDYYGLLGHNTSPSSTIKELKQAYRKRALELHPDKNPDDPEKAAKLFDTLKQAYELLLDEKQRALYDQKIKAKSERAERLNKQDGDRRKLREQLEAREREAMKQEKTGEGVPVMKKGGENEKKKMEDQSRAANAAAVRVNYITVYITCTSFRCLADTRFLSAACFLSLNRSKHLCAPLQNVNRHISSMKA